MTWRLGRHRIDHLYLQLGAEPHDGDPSVGWMLRVEDAVAARGLTANDPSYRLPEGFAPWFWHEEDPHVVRRPDGSLLGAFVGAFVDPADARMIALAAAALAGGPDDAGQDDFDALLVASSLGTPAAQRLIASTPDSIVDEVRARRAERERDGGGS